MPLWTHHRIFDHLVGIDSRKEFETIDIRRSVPDVVYREMFSEFP
jgi:hypothetical protein